MSALAEHWADVDPEALADGALEARVEALVPAQGDPFAEDIPTLVPSRKVRSVD